MLRLHRRRNQDPQPGSDLVIHPAVDDCAEHFGKTDTYGSSVATPIVLSPGLSELAPALASLLGDDFAVRTDGGVTEGLMVVGPAGPVGIAFLRASHPDVALLVVDRRLRYPQASEAVLHLEAGADGYLSCPTVAEIASHIRALARRTPTDALVAPAPAA